MSKETHWHFICNNYQKVGVLWSSLHPQGHHTAGADMMQSFSANWCMPILITVGLIWRWLMLELNKHNASKSLLCSVVFLAEWWKNYFYCVCLTKNISENLAHRPKDEMLRAVLEHLCSSISIRDVCLRAPVNPWPSPMQIRLKWVWSQHHEDLFDLCGLCSSLNEVVVGCCPQIVLSLCPVLNRTCFLFSAHFLYYFISIINISLLNMLGPALSHFTY